LPAAPLSAPALEVIIVLAPFNELEAIVIGNELDL